MGVDVDDPRRYPSAAGVDDIGIAFPGGETLGDSGAITFRFDPSYMKMAVDGAL